MLDAIRQLDENMKFAADDKQMTGVVQIQVSIPIEDVEGANPEQLRADVRAQVIKFLYGELISDLTELKADLATRSEWVCAKDMVIDPLTIIMANVEES